MTTLWTPAELAAWKPPELRSVSEWADSHRVLSRLVSAEPGPWRTDRAPYLREIMDAFQTRTVEQVTLAKSTQVGGTEAFHNVIGWTVAEDPVPIVLVMPRDTDVAQVIGRRLKPMFEASPALSEELTGWAGDWKTDELAFRRCILYGRASNSPAALASVAGGVLIGDECDKWPKYLGREASPWELAKERTRTFPSRKIGLVSTPTVPHGLIWQEFNAGDRRRYYVPCPHCRAFQVLEWESVRWPKELEEDPRKLKTSGAAFYECPHCGERIEDVHKRRMLLRGVWVPEGAEIAPADDGTPIILGLEDLETDHRSFHLWAGYSPWLTWSEIVAAFLLSRGVEEKERNFRNSWLGEPWSEVIDEPTPDGIRNRVRAYARDELPDDAEPVAVTMGIDTQKTELPYVVRAWGAGSSWLLRAGAARSWDGIEDLLDTPWGPGLRVGLACVDARYRTEEVYELARERPDQVRAIKGTDGESVQRFTTTKVDRHPLTGRPYKGSLIVWTVRVDPFRDRVAQSIASEDPDGWQVHADVSESYLRQLSSQEKVRIRGSGGGARLIWRTKAGHRHDHLWDCEVYALAAATMIGADRIRAGLPEQTDRLREKMNKVREARRARREGRRGPGFLDGVGDGWDR